MTDISQLINFSSKEKLTVVLQSEQAECGLACLVMVANYYGNKISLPTIRRKHSVSLKGADMLSLVKTANALQLSARPVKLELTALTMLQTPAILHWDLNHFVVLKSVSSKRATILDPSKGERTIELQELSKHFTGVAMELTPMSTFEKDEVEEKVKLSDFWQKIVGLPQTLGQILFLTFFLQVIAISSPFYMQLIIDEVVVGRNVQLLLLLVISFGFLTVVNTLTEVVRAKIILSLSSQINLQIGSNLFRHLITLPITYFEKRHVGDVISRFSSLNHVRELLSTSVVQAIIDGIMALLIVVIMFIYSVKLTSIVLAIMMLYFTVRMFLVKPLRKRTETKLMEEAKEQSNFIESLRGIQTIKMHGFQAERHSLWQALFANYINADIKVEKTKIHQNAIQSFLFGSENIIIGAIAALMVIDSELSLGMLFAFMAYKIKLVERVDNLTAKFIEFRMLKLHLIRLADIAYSETENELYQRAETIPLDFCPEGNLSLDNVSFRYAENEPLIFKSISLNIKRGESVSIIGASGCGKTTLAKIMCGLFIPTDGKVLIDGQDIYSVSLDCYRSHIAAVMQEDHLLSGSIYDNISFFDPDAEMERVQLCAKMASIHNDIMSMPMRYNSLVGDMGTTLSGGQKQRILFARALYRKPKLMFLDEATSHLDIETEKVINDSVKSLNITRIIVAHRPSTIEASDRILLLENGALREICREEWASKNVA